MKKTFFAGLAILLPIAVTLIIVFFFIDLLTTPFVDVVKGLITKHGTSELAAKHHYTAVFISRIIILVLLFLLTLLLGFLARKLLFSYLINLTQRIFTKIPIIKTIYRISKEISINFFPSDKKKLFKGTVSVPFPHSKSRALGLLSGDPPSKVAQHKENLQTVFIPTSPHPISGFLVMYNQEEVEKTDIETEDLFKFLLSCGLYHPGETRDEP